MTDKLRLLKVGGAELQEGPVLADLVAALATLAARGPLVVVHGGGPEIAALQARLGLEPRFVEGLRVTDDESLQVAEMVLSGLVNKRLTARLNAHAVRAIGLSGVDGGLLCAVRLRHSAGDLGHVGEITAVHADVLTDLLAAGFLPVVSPISLGPDGRPLNVNADHAALALAQALRVPEAIYLTNVPGVLIDGQTVATLGRDEVEQLIAKGVISGGMIPKVRSALEAIAQGVASVTITDLHGLATGGGTRIVPS
jgi:acetylglutamate kinase